MEILKGGGMRGMIHFMSRVKVSSMLFNHELKVSNIWSYINVLVFIFISDESLEEKKKNSNFEMRVIILLCVCITDFYVDVFMNN